MNVPSPLATDTAIPMAGQRPVTIVVCRTCKGPDWVEGAPKPGDHLAAAVFETVSAEPAGNRISAQIAECLGNCSRGCSAAILSPGDWHYVFGHLDAGSAADLMAGARLMGSVADGPMPWRGRPQALKTGMIARIPPLAPGRDEEG